MELVTVSDFFFTASLALLLSFIVAKLVSLVTTDTHITTKKHHVHHQPVGPVLQLQQQLTVQTESRTGFINPINPVQVTTTTTNLVTDHNTIDATEPTVESVSNGVNELPLTKLVIDGDVTEVETAVKNDDEIVEEIIEQNFNEEKEKDDDENNDGDDDDWEWEGIERSEMEKTFMVATEFVAEKGYIGNFDDDVEMELYGFHKVAMEGPCRESQPMALKLAARAKWNAWQKLGNMSPEVAMERYISLLSDKVPGWMKDHISAGMTEREPTGSEVSESAAPDLSSTLSNQQKILTGRELVHESSTPKLIPLAESDLENNVKK